MHRYEALKAFLLQYSKLKASPLPRSATHYVQLPQAWGLPDPSAAAAAAAAAQAATAAAAAALAATTLSPSPPGPADNGAPTSESSHPHPHPPPSSDESGLPPFAVSRAMLAESCGLGGGEACGKHGADVDLFLEQAVIAVSVLGWGLMM